MPPTSKEKAQNNPSWQHKPLPTIPSPHPHISITTKTTFKMVGGPIENIPRRRTSSTAAGELIRRMSNIFSSRHKTSTTQEGSTKRRPPALNLGSPHQQVPQITEASSLSEEDEKEDDIRRPSGLGRPVSISSLPPSPFSPSYNNNIFRSNGVVGNSDHVDGNVNEEKTGQMAPLHMPFGYVRARAISTPNPLRSMSLRSRGSKRSKKGRPRINSGISSREGTEGSHCDAMHHPRLPLQSSVPLPLPQSPECRHAANPVTISSMPIETIALIFTFIDSKSSIAKIAHTCQPFLFASQTALYTHINLDDFESELQLERFIALLAERQDFTDLVKSFRCTSWPTFFLPTTMLQPSMSSLSMGHLSSRSQLPHGGSSSLIHSTSPFLSPDHPDQDPDVRHSNALLTATFALAFQRMSNLTSLTLPTYDRDLLAYHTAFGLREITFLCSTMSKEEGKELFGWLDGQINVVKLEFPNLLAIDGDPDYRFSSDGASEEKTGIVGRSKVIRPATSTGCLRQDSGPATVSGGSRGGRSGGKKYLVAPYLVPLDSTSSPSSSPSQPPPRTDSSRTPAIRLHLHIRDPIMKLSPRPKSAAPDSPLYTTFSEAVAAAAAAAASPTSNNNQPSLPSPISPSQIPFPTSSSTPRLQPPNSPLSSPTLLPNLTILQGPPFLIIALSSPPASPSPSPISPPSPTSSRRPLHSISLNITTTLYSGLRPAFIMSHLTGTTRTLTLRFGETVDKRSIEKVLGAVGSSLGGIREQVNDYDDKERRDIKSGAGSMNDGPASGRGEWKGLIELHVELTAGGPGSDEGLHRMISSAMPRYPYLRVLTLTYIPPGSLAITGSTSSPVLNGQPTNLSPQNTLPTPPQSTSLLPTTPTSFVSSTISGLTATPLLTPLTANAPTDSMAMISPVPPRNDSLKLKKRSRSLSPPEQAYIRQWTKHCVDLKRVVFLSGSEWLKGRNLW